MPFDYRVDSANRRILVTASDPVDLPQTLAVLDRQVQEGAWGQAALIDMRAVSWVPSKHDIEAVAERLRALSARHGPRGPVAFVTSENLALFGMIRMYAILADVRHLEVMIDVFLTPEEASEWLNYRVGRAPG